MSERARETGVTMTAEGTELPANALVVAENVHKNFGRLEVLRGIDLQVRRGEVMCIIGPSGRKSTFLRCINHLEKLTAAVCGSTAS